MATQMYIPASATIVRYIGKGLWSIDNPRSEWERIVGTAEICDMIADGVEFDIVKFR